MAKSKHIDPIPEKFASLEEASDFWDTHDAGDYEEFMRPIPEGLEFVDSLPQAVLLEHTLLQALGKRLTLRPLRFLKPQRSRSIKRYSVGVPTVFGGTPRFRLFSHRKK